ncbi:MAG: hypothetical protein ACOCUV_01975, partial [bacterium]
MKIIFTITVLLSVCMFKIQGQIKLVPIEYNEQEAPLNKLKSSLAPGPNDRIEWSRNKENVVVVEHIEGMGLKGFNKIVKLYDKSGRLLAASDSLDLYEWEVKPLGDDETVLVIFPAGTARKAVIRTFKNINGTLKETNKFLQNTASFSLDITYNGDYYICGLSSSQIKGSNSQIFFFNKSGNILWKTKVNAPILYSLKISNNYVIFTTKAYDNDKYNNVYISDYQGNVFLKNKLDSKKGNYEIELSDYNKDRFIAIATLKHVYLFDTRQKKLVNEFKTTTQYINSYKITDNGTIISTAVQKEFSREQKQYNYFNKKLFIKKTGNSSQKLKINMEGEPEIIKDKT